MNTKNEFIGCNLQYPAITRHGWNYPPRGLNRFYTINMNVLADASLNFPYIKMPDSYYKNNDFGDVLNKVMKYRYNWPEEIELPIPFYTNIKGEVNNPWDGIESHRGLIEIPITTNCYGNRDSILYQEKNVVDLLPNGALVSIWGHPGNNLKKIKPLIKCVTDNYQIHFVYINEY